MATKDGGPAFPAPENLLGSYVREGMSLRDWFAGQFIAAYCDEDENDSSTDEWDFPFIAKCAYKLADAMLRARENVVDGGGRGG